MPPRERVLRGSVAGAKGGAFVSQAQLITVAELARAIGWRTERMRRRLARLKVLRRAGHLYYTTPERLALADPDALEAYLSSLAPEPDPDECPACADMRLSVAELES